jgi:hypothetical protein
MNVEIGTEAPIFLFWEYLFQIFGILSLQCMCWRGEEDKNKILIMYTDPAEMYSAQIPAHEKINLGKSEGGGVHCHFKPRSIDF